MKKTQISKFKTLILLALLLPSLAFAGSETDNLKLYKPAYGEAGATWTSKLNQNADIIDRISPVDAKSFGSKTLTSATINAAITAISTNERALLLTPGAWAITTDVTVPSNVTLVVARGAVMDIANGVTVTINGSIEAPDCKIVTLTGTGKLDLSAAKMSSAPVVWWNDNILQGYASGISVLRLAQGSYTLSGKLSLADGRSIEGAGHDKTNITYNGSDNAIESDSVDAWRLKGFTLTGNASAKNGVYITDVDDGIEIEDLKITGFTNSSYGRGVYFEATLGNGIYFGNYYRVISSGNYIGVEMDTTDASGHRCNVHNFYGGIFNNNSSDGFKADYADGVSLYGCEIEDNGGIGLNVDNVYSFNVFGGWLENNTGGNLNFKSDSRINLWHARLNLGDVLYNGSTYTTADLVTTAGKVRFLNDGNAEADSPKNWFGLIDDAGGTTYSSRTFERTSGTSDVLKFQTTGAANPCARMYANGKILWGDCTSSVDTNLYRNSADQLKTDDKFVCSSFETSGLATVAGIASSAKINVTRGLYTNESLGSAVSGDSYDRFVIRTDGKISSGSGAGVTDTHLERSSAGVWKVTSDITDGTYNFLKALSGSATWNPASLDDGAGETSSSVTVTGAALGDFCISSAPYDMQGIVATCYVDAADSAKIRIQNETGGTIDLASGTWRVRIIKQ